jgi:hypothetical protein
MVEGTVVSCGPVPMCPRLVWYCSGEGGSCWLPVGWHLESHQAISIEVIGCRCSLWDGTEVRRGSTYKQGESRRGERRQGNREMSPYTCSHTVFSCLSQKHTYASHEALQECLHDYQGTLAVVPASWVSESYNLNKDSAGDLACRVSSAKPTYK